MKTIKKNTSKALRLKFIFWKKYIGKVEIWAKECFVFKVERGVAKRQLKSNLRYKKGLYRQAEYSFIVNARF